MSYVRRERLKTVLYTKHLKSGKEINVYSDLDRDQQEAWAVFGTYPNYSWLNKNEIIIAIDGKIRRLNIKTKQTAIIPFSVDVEKRFANALHPKQQLNDVEDVKLIRWAKQRGDQIIFSALGKIYEKDGIDTPAPLYNETFKQYIILIENYIA